MLCLFDMFVCYLLYFSHILQNFKIICTNMCKLIPLYNMPLWAVFLEFV